MDSIEATAEGAKTRKAKRACRRAEIKLLISLCKSADIGTNGRLLACVLLGYAGNSTGLCWPKTSTLIEATGLSESGLRKAMRELEGAGIVRTARAAPGRARIVVGAVTFDRSQALYVVWPVATPGGKELFAGYVAPHAKVSDPSATTWQVRPLANAPVGQALSTDRLRADLAAGRIAPTRFVRAGDMAWTPAIDVAALASACPWPLTRAAA